MLSRSGPVSWWRSGARPPFGKRPAGTDFRRPQRTPHAPVSHVDLVFTVDRIEDGKEGAPAGTHFKLLCFLSADIELISAAFELTQEGAEHAGEPVGLSQLNDAVIDGRRWTRVEGDMRCELFCQGVQQPSCLPLIAVGLDQDGSMLGMDAAFPILAGKVFITVDERCGA